MNQVLVNHQQQYQQFRATSAHHLENEQQCYSLNFGRNSLDNDGHSLLFNRDRSNFPNNQERILYLGDHRQYPTFLLYDLSEY